MAVVQEAFDIPADIMTKLLTGEYRRIGGVVRNAVGPHRGRIVKHLKPVDLKTAEQVQREDAQIMKFMKKNKKGLLIGAAIAVAATVGGALCHKVKNREPVVITQFRAALHTYIEKVRKGRLELNTIETLMAALDELKQYKNYEKFEIEFSTEDFDVLVSRIYNYTRRLAENNKIELTELDRSETNNVILNLQNYLRAQKRIFEEAA